MGKGRGEKGGPLECLFCLCIVMPIWIGAVMVSKSNEIQFNIKASKTWVTGDCLILAKNLKGPYRRLESEEWFGTDVPHYGAESGDEDASSRQLKASSSGGGDNTQYYQVLLRVQPVNLTLYNDEMCNAMGECDYSSIYYESYKNAYRYPYWQKKDTSKGMFTNKDKANDWRSKFKAGQIYKCHWDPKHPQDCAMNLISSMTMDTVTAGWWIMSWPLLLFVVACCLGICASASPTGTAH